MTLSIARLLSVASISLGVIGPCTAEAYSVYQGCAAPPATPSGNVHYVDPAHGSNSGDGTAAHPWHTLTEVVAAGLFYNTPVKGLAHINPSAPIQAGDTVYLLSGNHGPVLFQGSFGKGLVGYNNSSFITIAALPGQTPVLSQLTVKGGSKWVFHGLTIQSVNNTGSYITVSSNQDYTLVNLLDVHSDIILDSNILTSTSNVSQWKPFDWMSKRASGVKDYGGTCISITGNSIKYVGFGIQTQNSDKVMLQSNKVNYFTDDGIDFGSNDTQISSNTITNSIEDGDGFHRDGIQGQPYSQTTVLNNVQIRNNTIIRLTDPKLAYPGYLQGIDEFDGIWTNISVTSNIVITDASQGIAFYGVNGGSIVGNTLLGDSGIVVPCSNATVGQCQVLPAVYDTSTVPRVTITSSKAGVPSNNITIMNNTVSGLGADLNTGHLLISDNTCVLTGKTCIIGIPVNGQILWGSKPGVYGSRNVVSTLTAAGMFTQFDTTAMKFNLTLKWQ
jgi:hypothetical protein